LVVASAQEEPSRRPELEPKVSTAAPPRPADGSPGEPWRIGADAAGLFGLGVLEQPSLGGALGVSLWTPFGFGVRLRGLRAVARSKPLDPGETQVDLWAGMLSGCYRIGHESSIRLIPCADLGWGRQHAEARGLLVRNSEVDRRWLVVGPSVGLALPLASGVSAGATLGMSVRLHDQAYSVDGDVAQQQPAAGGYALLGLLAEWPISGRSSQR
jgi:hypothetical protein